ncbi:MAG: hypothetical protein Q9224_003183 [Gallowayella concinna]
MESLEAVQIQHLIEKGKTEDLARYIVAQNKGKQVQGKDELGLAQHLAETLSSGYDAQDGVKSNRSNAVQDDGLSKKRAVFGSGKQIIGRTSMD